MKILVISDTHGIIIDSLAENIKNEKDIDLFIHCGDKYKDTKKLSQLLGIHDFYCVVGNCDYDVQNGESMLELSIENKRILVTHGHLQNVKDGLDDLKIVAKKKSADIVLFGHTHIAHNRVEDGILYFNPGSATLPKNSRASYGIIEISGDKINSRIETV